MSIVRTSSLHLALLAGMLSRTPSSTSVAALCGLSKSTVAASLSGQSFGSEARSMERASLASSSAYFAFDYTQSFHSGSEMQGLAYAYSSTHRGPKLGQRYASVALVAYGELPVPIELTYAVSRELETEHYPFLTPSKKFIETSKRMKSLGLQFKGMLVDGEFGTGEVIDHAVINDDALLVRMKGNARVEYCGESMTLKSLLSHVPKNQCHFYSKFNWRAKRVAVQHRGHTVDIIIIWRGVKGIWKAFFLLSTFARETSLGELVRAWKARWGIEVIHRFLKQNLSFGNCQYKDIKAHQNWADLALDAFHLILRERFAFPEESWKSSQLRAAEACLERVRTALLRDLSELEAA